MAKKMTGTVVSNSMDKTVVVRVELRKQHPVYKKVVRRHRKFFAHVADDKKPAVGTIVSIVSVRPISRNTHFKVIEAGSSK